MVIKNPDVIIEEVKEIFSKHLENSKSRKTPERFAILEEIYRRNDKNLAQYEKSYGFKQHDHLICEDCGKVLEFCDPRIQQIKEMMGDILKFNITAHSLNLYGNCAGACERTQK